MFNEYQQKIIEIMTPLIAAMKAAHEANTTLMDNRGEWMLSCEVEYLTEITYGQFEWGSDYEADDFHRAYFELIELLQSKFKDEYIRYIIYLPSPLKLMLNLV